MDNRIFKRKLEKRLSQAEFSCKKMYLHNSEFSPQFDKEAFFNKLRNELKGEEDIHKRFKALQKFCLKL